MAGEIVTKQELIDAKVDAKDLGEAMNERVIVNPRYGDSFKSLPLLTDEAQEKINSWQQAINTITVNDGVPALAVSDLSGLNQQQLNSGINTIADLATIPSPKNGNRVFVKGLRGGWFEYNSSKSSINDSGMIFNGWVRISLETCIKPEWFGAVRDGVTDDAESIRKTLAYCKNSTAKRIFFTKGDQPYTASTVDVNNSAFSIDQSNIYLDFETGNTEIKATAAMGSILYFSAAVYKQNIQNGLLNCNSLANYGINTLKTIYTPQLQINFLTVNNALIDGVYLQTYVADITMLTVNGGQRGIVIRPTSGNITTSINLKSCYVLNQTVCGYDISIACYCSMIACAADHMPLAYKITARGASMSGCGAENIAKIAEFSSFRGLSINGFYSQRCGSDDTANPTAYLMEFVTGQNATLSGLYIEQPKSYTYKVGITTANFGSESLTITDNSVTRAQAYFVPNFTYTRPIKFLIGDETQKDETISKTVEELPAYLKQIEFMTINHNLVIQLADGVQTEQVNPFYIQGFKGNGTLTIQGNPTNRALVELTTGERLIARNNSATIILKNLTMRNVTSSASSRLLQTQQCDDVIIDNVRFASSVNAGSAVYNTSSKVSLINGTIADGSFPQSAMNAFHSIGSAVFNIAPSTSAPTSGIWTNGMQILNSSPSTHIGWVYSASSWKTYGAIS